MQINWGYIKLISLVLLTGGLYVFGSHRNEQRLVTDVTVQFDDESKPFVTRESVNKLLIQSGVALTKTSKEKLALKEIESQVNAHPLVKNSEVYVNMDGSLGVDVQQRKPVARVSGETPFYIGEEGEVMPLSTNFSARVPLVTGVSKADAKEVYELITFIREDEFLKKHIVGIKKNENGEYILSPRIYDYKLRLGKVDKLPLRFNNYKAFYKKAHNDQTLKQCNMITLKYDNHVVCTRKQ